ncbi:MAG: carboxypeptidase regulatory-like domain-containing protein [Elusimicrobia bacterium]|nr:carboxypeptidase regulatory-like domain-containing protein [Elusimicrobiota bacterium]
MSKSPGRGFAAALVAALLIGPAAEAAAAIIVFNNGGGDGNWYTSSNWDLGRCPFAADDVLIPAGSVFVDASSPAVQANALVLGNGSSAASLRVSTGVAFVATATVLGRATFIIGSTSPVVFSSFTIQAGGELTHDGPLQISSAAAILFADRFELKAGATVSLQGKGYAGGGVTETGFGPGGGPGSGTYGGNGGGYASTGGNGNPAAGGPSYGSYRAPDTPGSGGGGMLAPCYGGHGGGVFRLRATTATVDGLIDARGTTGLTGCLGGGGGGSGGAIYIQTDYLLGAGTLTVQGGSGGGGVSYGGGGGSGGRIAVVVTGENTSKIYVSTGSGAGGTGFSNGSPASGPGSSFLQPKIWLGGVGEGSFCSLAANWLAGIPPQNGEGVVFGSTSPAAGCYWDLPPSVALSSLTLRPDYSGQFRVNSVLAVAGPFALYGGTASMALPIDLQVGGDFIAGNGRFTMSQGTVVFNGSSLQTVNVGADSVFLHIQVSGSSKVVVASDLLMKGNLSVLSGAALSFPYATMLRSSGSISAAGSLTFDPAHRTIFAGTALQRYAAPSIGRMEVENPVGLLVSSWSTVNVLGDVLIATGAVLNASTATLNLSKDWLNYGTFNAPGSSVNFVSATAAQRLIAGGRLHHLGVSKPSQTLSLSTAVVLSGTLTVTAGTLDWMQLEHHIRGSIVQMGGGFASTNTLVLDGVSTQTVSLTAGTSFHHLISSNTMLVRFLSAVAVKGDLKMHRGVLDISSKALSLEGSFLNLGGSALAVNQSTVTFSTTAVQTLSLGGTDSLDSLVIANTGGGVLLATPNLKIRRNFTVAPGAVFNGGSSTMTLQGSGGLWSTAGADYRAAGPHAVVWSASGLLVAPDSTVSARISIPGAVTLQGDLFLIGNSRLSLQSGGVLNAASSTITLRGDSDMACASGSRYVYDQNSWIVYEGTGTDRGQFLSTGPFSNIRLNPERTADSFSLRSLTLAGSLVVERGLVRSSAAPVIEVRGHLINSGGAMDLAGESTSTLRLAGTVEQQVRTSTADVFWRFEAASSSRVVVAASSMNIRENFLLASGKLSAGSSWIALRGDWQGAGGLFEAGSSTVAFWETSAGARQTFSDATRPALHGVVVGVSTAVFASAFTADVLTSTKPGSLLQFPSAGVSTVKDLRVHGGAMGTRIRLRSVVEGARWGLELISASTVAFADIQDSSATAGLMVHADDATSVDAGNNLNWNFKPLLVALAPGETFAERVGKGGSAAVQTAGSPFTVTVRAVSAATTTVVGSSMTVGIELSDAFGTASAAHALSASTGAFTVTLKTAEPTAIQATSSWAFAAGSSTVEVKPAGFSKLLVLLPGEEPLPGSPAGRVLDPDSQNAGNPFNVTVRAVDAYNNLRSDAPNDTVVIDSVTASSATLPGPAVLSAGTAVVPDIFVYSAGGGLSVRARDLTNGAILFNISSTFSIFAVSFSTPQVSFLIPQSASVATLGGRLAGTAQDSVAIERVDLAVRDNASGFYYDLAHKAFDSAQAVMMRTNVSPAKGSRVDWDIPFPDLKLVSGRDYFVLIKSSNTSDVLATMTSTFTYDCSALSFGESDGKGSAALQPSIGSACQAVVSTLTFTTGAGGIGPGGAVALRIPEGWTRPAALSAAPDPALGYVNIESTSTAWTGSVETLVEPASLGGAELGTNWLALRLSSAAANSFKPGEEIRFKYHGFPPSGPLTGDQVFDLRTQAASGGVLAGIASLPRIWLKPGPARNLRFTTYEPTVLGPLQTSATMQVQVIDLCGNAVAAPSTITVRLAAGTFGASGFNPDLQAEFFRIGGSPISAITISSSSQTSEAFYYRTSTSGVSFEHVRATALVSGVFAEASRQVTLLESSVTLREVSIDTGSLAPGATSAALGVGGGAQAVVRFTLSDPRVSWDVIVSTDPGAYSPALFSAAGMGDALRPIQAAWNGVVCAENGVCRFADPGRYFVRVRAAGGAPAAALEVRIPATASVFGNLGAGGASAFVRAEGPGAGLGAFAVASATGYFRIYGLTAGQAYNLYASTLSAALGQAVHLSTSATSVQATAAGGDAGSLTLPAPAFIRVGVGIPIAAPFEFWGEVSAHTSDFSQQALATLHFSSGSAVSDDGGPGFGRAASTWTVLSLAPGLYDLDIRLDRIRISTRIAGVALPAGGIVDVRLDLARKANLFGRVSLSTAPAAGAWVSVQATRQGELLPAAFTGVFIPAPAGGVSLTSGVYSLYGLDPGTWTLQATSPGFLSTSSTVIVSTDIGDPATRAEGPSLSLDTGAVLSGIVSVKGNTTSLALAGQRYFRVFVDAYDPRTFAHAVTEVRLATASSVSESTFSLSGLATGEWQLSAEVPGFEKSPLGPQSVLVTGAGAPEAELAFVENSSRIQLSILLPPLPGGACRPPADYKGIGFSVEGPQLSLPATGDITSLDGRQGVVEAFHCSSMTMLSPALGSGLFRFRLAHGPSGNQQELTLALANRATASAVVDLSRATYPVTGKLSLSGLVSFSKGGFAVSVSSVAGILANSATSAWCLLSSSLPLTLSNLHMELVAYEPENGLPGPFARSTGSCAYFPATSAPLGYAASVAADGSFAFPGVSSGVYLLRSGRDIDGLASNGDELADASSVVRVDSATVADVRIGNGWRISGVVRLPPEASSGRPVAVSLADLSGQRLRTAPVNFLGERWAAYSFDKVADGRYAVAAEDASFPKAFAAKPLSVAVQGADLSGQNLQLASAGALKGRLAVEHLRPDGSREFVLISSDSRGLLPSGLRIFAVANPWVDGGFFEAENLIGAGGQFTIPSVLPGLYDIEAQAPAAFGGGSLSLVGESRSGVRVAAGAVSDVGVIRIRMAAALYGRVVDPATGLGLANIPMRVRPSLMTPGQASARREPPSARTDADGNYLLGGLDPVMRYYDVIAGYRGEGRLGGFTPAYEEKVVRSVDVQSTTTLIFALLPAPFAISGRVLARAGEPLSFPAEEGSRPGAKVYVQKQGIIPVENPLGDIVVQTDEQGNFSVPALTAGVYKLSVSALGYGSLARVVQVSSAGVDMGTISLDWGGTLSGSLLKSDGTAPGEDEVREILAATPDLGEVLSGSILRDPNTRTAVGYRISGFKPDSAYRVLLLGSDGQLLAPAEARSVVFTSSLQARGLDIALRFGRPFLLAKSRRIGSAYRIDVTASSPLRSKTAADEDMPSILEAASERGALSGYELSQDRRRVSALYSPSIRESSFTLRFTAFSSQRDPDAVGAGSPEFLHSATFTFYRGLDGYHRSVINNVSGGAIALESEPGRLTLPKGAFAVDASSSVELSLACADENLTARRMSASRSESLRFDGPAYPQSLLRAMAAVPPEVSPLSAFYDVMLPLGVRSALSKPAQLTLRYREGADPGALNVYWYNPAANAYILQQDASGSPPVIDAANRTITVNVDHFSTFVLFNVGAAVISGSAFQGGEIDAFNFPNPFDLSVKTVTSIHGALQQTVRGTMIRIAVPAAVGGEGPVQIFNVAGERVRTIELGSVAGGRHYYQGWDGRNDSGRDVASGIYLAEVKIGKARKFFKMALIK